MRESGTETRLGERFERIASGFGSFHPALLRVNSANACHRVNGYSCGARISNGTVVAPPTASNRFADSGTRHQKNVSLRLP